MDLSFLFPFDADTAGIEVPSELNNPFSSASSQISALANKEFQDFIQNESHKWEHDFAVDKGKMFGVLVVQNNYNELFYIATVSGKLKGTKTSERFIPSVFQDSTEDFRINKGMTELTVIGKQIADPSSELSKNQLIELRKEKSNKLQRWLFDNYIFLNKNGTKKTVTGIFQDFKSSSPPAAAGECAAPKLLNYAFSNELKPIAISEFWWGLSPKSENREHLKSYPACENKCRPILEFMLADHKLFDLK
jgi:tRNA pseudouridine32 synthase/23S rRNA pseudouridine746 synthase